MKADGKGAVEGGVRAVPGAIVGATSGAAYKSMIRALEVTKGWDLWWLP